MEGFHEKDLSVRCAPLLRWKTLGESAETGLGFEFFSGRAPAEPGA